MDAYFINTLEVQKRVFLHVSFMSSCTSALYRLSDLTHKPRTMQPIISSPSEKYAGNVDAEADKDSQAAFEERLLFFLSGGPKLAVVSPTSDERSCGKKYSSSTRFWFDFSVFFDSISLETRVWGGRRGCNYCTIQNRIQHFSLKGWFSPYPKKLLYHYKTHQKLKHLWMPF